MSGEIKMGVYQYENPQGKLWMRPLAMFAEVVEHGGYSGPRFALIEETERAA